MKYRVTAAVAAALLASEVFAQVNPQPAPKPTPDQTQAPENQASDPLKPAEAATAPAQQTNPAPTTAPAATAPKKPKWNVEAPPGMRTREVPIKVDNGSWMNVDVSRDGRLIAFDLLGDIYTMPIAGGTPTRIAQGLSY